MNNESSTHTILSFCILLIISEAVRHFYKKNKEFSTSVGSIIMAVGIFTLFALQELPIGSTLITQLITLELLILWIYIAIFNIILYIKGDFFTLIRTVNSKLGIGTWVACSAVVGMLFLNYFSDFHIIIWTISLFALSIWLVYIRLFLYHFWRIFSKNSNVHSGVILLTTVSTQSIVLLMNSLIPNQIPITINQALILLGYVFYVIGFTIIVKYCFSIKLKRLVLSWSNTNSIIHGALSITGLGVTSH